MKTQTYTGILANHSYGEYTPVLYISSVESPLAEHLRWIRNKQVTVSYYITDIPCTKEEAKEDFIKKLSGSVSTKFNTRYSDITGYLWTDEECKIGGHDLIEELGSYIGKFVILEITLHD